MRADSKRNRTTSSGRPPIGIGFWIAAGWVGLLSVMCLLADVLPFIQDPLATKTRDAMQGPSWRHWFGVDSVGRDVFSRVVHGGQVSLLIGITAATLGIAIGVAVGVASGYIGGALSSLAMGTTDVMLAFPALVLVLSIVSFRGQGITTIVGALALLSVPNIARIARSTTLSVVGCDYVTASRMSGARSFRIVLREVLPNVLPSILSFAFVVVGVLIVAEGGLSFLGLGIAKPDPSWGNMIIEGKPDLDKAPWITAAPGTLLFVTVLALSMASDRLQSHFDSRAAKI